MWFAILAPCLWLALWSTKHKGLQWYFAANFAEAFVAWLVLLRYPYDSKVFAWTFAPFALLIFLSALPLLLESIFRVPERFYLLCLSAFLGALLFRIASYDHPMGRNECIEYLNGAGDVFLGTSCAVGAAYLKLYKDSFWKPALSLGLMLLAQSLYEFGWGINWINSQAWRELNQWMPTAILAVGSLWLAYSAHNPDASPSQSYRR